MTRKTAIASLVALTLCLIVTAGCIVDLHGDGKVWMEYGHRIEFGHRADKSTPDQESHSEWNFQPTKDIIDGVQDALEPADPPATDG